jgi:hypothetical protein
MWLLRDFLGDRAAALVSAAALLFLAPLNAEAQNERDPVYDALIGIAVPGATVRPGENPEIVVDGKVKHALTPGYMVLDLKRGTLALLAVDFKDDLEQAVDAVEDPSVTNPHRALSRLAIARIGMDGKVVSQATGLVDPEAVVTQVGSLNVTGTPEDGWPELHVTYRGMYRLPNSVGTVAWEALWDPHQSKIVERLPVGYWKHSKGVADQGGEIQVTRLPGSVTLQVGAKSLTYRCDGRCVVPVELILSAI